jgi:hypothetical protein
MMHPSFSNGLAAFSVRLSRAAPKQTRHLLLPTLLLLTLLQATKQQCNATRRGS